MAWQESSTESNQAPQASHSQTDTLHVDGQEQLDQTNQPHSSSGGHRLFEASQHPTSRAYEW